MGSPTLLCLQKTVSHRRRRRGGLPPHTESRQSKDTLTPPHTLSADGRASQTVLKRQSHTDVPHKRQSEDTLTPHTHRLSADCLLSGCLVCHTLSHRRHTQRRQPGDTLTPPTHTVCRLSSISACRVCLSCGRDCLACLQTHRLCGEERTVVCQRLPCVSVMCVSVMCVSVMCVSVMCESVSLSCVSDSLTQKSL